jgi:hypothetical protein
LGFKVEDRSMSRVRSASPGVIRCLIFR